MAANAATAAASVAPSAPASASASAPTLPRGLWIPQLGEGAGAWLLLGPGNQVLRVGDLAEMHGFDLPEGLPPLAAAKDQKGQWGYLNTEGQWAMAPQWDMARGFTEDGLARVQKNGLWGYVGTDLKIRIKPTWPQASPFSHGRAVVKMANGSVGAIDTSGALVVVPARYRLIGEFAANGLARVATTSERWGYIDRQGTAAFDTAVDLVLDFNDYPVAPAELKDRWGLLDARGNWVKKPTWDGLAAFQVPGLAPFRTADYKTGYIDLKGNEVIPAGELSSHIGQGLIRSGSPGSTRFSFVDTQGKTAIPGPFDWADDFGPRGPVTARQKGQWGLVTTRGQWISAGPDREPLWSVSSGVHATQDELSLWLHAAQAIEWKNGQGETVYRLTQRGQPSSKQVVLELWAQDKVVWTSAPQTQALNLKPFFEPRLQDSLLYNNAELVAEAQRMLAAKPRKFLPYSLVFRGRSNPYDMKDLEEDDEALVALGAMTTLAETYVDEEQWGAYYFLMDQRAELFKAMSLQACNVLKAAFGAPQKPSTPDAQPPWSLRASPCAWQVGQQWLALVAFFETGDGDFEHQLALVVVPNPKK